MAVISDDELMTIVADKFSEMHYRIEDGEFGRSQLFELKRKIEEILDEYE